MTITTASFLCPHPNCDTFPWDTADELAAHIVAEHYGTAPRPEVPTVRRGDFVTGPNGFGGTTTRRVPIVTADPPTERQVAFLRSLLTGRQGIAAAEVVRDDLNRRREAGQLSRVVVSEAIDRLLKITTPRRDEGTPGRLDRPTLPEVPAGHYAIESTGDNDLVFYRIDRPTEGKYAGRTFVKMVVGGKPDQNVAYSHIAGILARIIEAGIAASATTYGREIGRCHRCNRTLTDETSRAYGIGPECRSKAA